MSKLIIIVRLTDARLAQLDHLGAQRRASAAGAVLHVNPLDPQVDGPNDYDRTEGGLGEYAFQEWSGRPMRTDLGPDGGFDFIMPNDERLDVKYTRHELGCFLPRYDEGLKAELGVLANRIEDDPHLVKLHGWLTREEWLAETRFRDTFKKRIGEQQYYPRGLMHCMCQLVSRTGLSLPDEWRAAYELHRRSQSCRAMESSR
jgi:hypothetical protein